VTHLATWLSTVPPLAIYLAAFAFPFAEASIFLGFVLPGETAVVLAGALAAQHRAAVWAVLVAAVLGAVSGDVTGYLVGRRLGPALRCGRVGRWVGEPRWRTAEAALRRRGGPAVFVGRSTALLRALVPAAAGASGLRWPTFLAWNALGGLAWATTATLVGYAAGASYAVAAARLGRAGLVLAGLVVVGLLGTRWVRARRRRQRTGAPR
jgi:undecaprenyl-diphosphatase